MNDEFGAEFWNERYRRFGPVYDGETNQQLIDEASLLQPGRALDAGCGEGADALWLAQRGWDVTAVDISSVAIDRGRRQSQRLGAKLARRITWVEADIRTWPPPPSSFDLVTAHFLQFANPVRTDLMRRLSAAVAPGGTLLIVAHHPSDLQTTVKRPPLPEYFYEPDEIAALLEPQQWHIHLSEVRPRRVVDPAGDDVVVHDSIVKARRTG